MNLKKLYSSQAINVLIALLIGIFIIFPDVIRYFDEPEFSGIPNRDIHAPEMQEHLMPFPGQDKPPEFIPPAGEKPEPPKHLTKGRGAQPILFDFIYFFVLSWGLLLLNNPNWQKRETSVYFFSPKIKPLVTIAGTLVICYIGIFIYSIFGHGMRLHFNPFPWYLDGILLFKGLFVFVSVVLFGQLSNLLYKQQNMIVENEKLKTESMQNRFEALTAQISPHFFFNSLNSLSGLVRDNQNKKALKFISEISNLFRYILKGNWQELVTLKEEMFFLKAYQYLLDIKYEKKLSFDIVVNQEDENRFMLPALSMQPLVENIIKHNIISEEMPMTIRVYITENNVLVIENKCLPRIVHENGTGIGLSNLDKRYKYLTGKAIRSYIHKGTFTVELPLTEIK